MIKLLFSLLFCTISRFFIFLFSYIIHVSNILISIFEKNDEFITGICNQIMLICSFSSNNFSMYLVINSISFKRDLLLFTKYFNLYEKNNIYFILLSLFFKSLLLINNCCFNGIALVLIFS